MSDGEDDIKPGEGEGTPGEGEGGIYGGFWGLRGEKGGGDTPGSLSCHCKLRTWQVRILTS